MSDVTFIVLTLFFFGVAHIYVTACDKLKVRPKP
jgi:hypothetical protein